MSNMMSGSNHLNSNIQRIEIKIRIDEPLYVKELLINYFLFKDSPTYPVFVKFDPILNRSTGEANSRNFRIVEYDEMKDYSSELATIEINPFPSHIVVFIELVSEDDDSWGKVKIIAKEIITQMVKLDFKIEYVKPADLVPKKILTQVKNGHNVVSKKKPFVPTDEKALARWKKAYKIIKRLDKEYKKEYEEGNADNPEPKMEDYIDALVHEMGRKMSRRTIERIRAAGDDELLE